MNWSIPFAPLAPFVFRLDIEGGGGGTALALDLDGKRLCLATAAHVARRASERNAAIQLSQPESGIELRIAPTEWRAALDAQRDSAEITAHVSHAEADYLRASIPSRPLALLSSADMVPPGTPVAWAGHPANALEFLCLYQGMVSAVRERSGSYLITGIAGGGLSGAPVFVEREGAPCVVGFVSGALREPDALASTAERGGLIVVNGMGAFETWRDVRPLRVA